MSETTTTYEVWDGMGNHRLSTPDQNEAYKLKHDLNDQDIWAKVHTTRTWPCKKCGRTVTCTGRDVDCDCGACYNAFGQRLVDNWRDNPSCYDDEIGDMEGSEIASLRRDAWLDGFTNG